MFRQVNTRLKHAVYLSASTCCNYLGKVKSFCVSPSQQPTPCPSFLLLTPSPCANSFVVNVSWLSAECSNYSIAVGAGEREAANQTWLHRTPSVKSHSQNGRLLKDRADPLLLLLMLKYNKAIKNTFTIIYHVRSRMSHRFVLQAHRL